MYIANTAPLQPEVNMDWFFFFFFLITPVLLKIQAVPVVSKVMKAEVQEGIYEVNVST